MKIKFDSTELAGRLRIIKSSLTATKGVPGEDLIGLAANGTQLIAYGYAKSAWVRVVTTCTILEEGVIIVERSRFFRLLEALKEETMLRTLPNGRIEIVPQKTKGKFILSTTKQEMPRPRIDASVLAKTFDAKPFRDQLTLNILDSELTGGGYLVKSNTTALEIMATDKTRLIVTNQIFKTLAPNINLSIHAAAIKGVFEIMKAATTVDIKTSANLSSFMTTLGDGTSIEYGYTNEVASFPNVSAILAFSDFPNSARFEAGDLIAAIDRASALADDELPFVDFNFKSADECTLEAFNKDGSAEMGLDCPSEIEEETTKILRIQIPHLKSLLNKARASSASWVTCRWGEKKPVRWRFEFEDDEFADIEMTYITAALNRGASKQKKETT